MRTPYQDVWKVIVCTPEDEDNEDREPPGEIIFTNQRAAKAFVKAVEPTSAWVLGPWKSTIYRTAKFALAVGEDGNGY